MSDQGNNEQRGTVVVLSRDLFFGMRIRTTLRGMGYTGVLTQDAATFTQHLTDTKTAPVLGLIDFNQPVNWNELAPAIAAGVPILAFGAHTDVEGFRAAKEAGVTRVLANGAFSRTLPELLEKYALRPPSF